MADQKHPSGEGTPPANDAVGASESKVPPVVRLATPIAAVENKENQAPEIPLEAAIPPPPNVPANVEASEAGKPADGAEEAIDPAFAQQREKVKIKLQPPIAEPAAKAAGDVVIGIEELPELSREAQQQAEILNALADQPPVHKPVDNGQGKRLAFIAALLALIVVCVWGIKKYRAHQAAESDGTAIAAAAETPDAAAGTDEDPDAETPVAATAPAPEPPKHAAVVAQAEPVKQAPPAPPVQATAPPAIAAKPSPSSTPMVAAQPQPVAQPEPPKPMAIRPQQPPPQVITKVITKVIRLPAKEKIVYLAAKPAKPQVNIQEPPKVVVAQDTPKQNSPTVEPKAKKVRASERNWSAEIDTAADEEYQKRKAARIVQIPPPAQQLPQ